MPALDTLTASADSIAEVSNNLAADREQQFMDVVGEVVPDDTLDEPTEATAPEPVAADPTVPADPAEPAPEPVTDDPLKDAKPFSYTVDGESRTFDGIKVFHAPDGAVTGAVIPAASIPDVQYKIQRADYLEGQNKTLYERTRQFDAIEAQTPKGETLRGLDAVQHYVAEHAKLTAAVKLMASVLEDPDKLAALYSDPREMQYLAKELGFTARDAEAAARQQFGQRTTQYVQQETQQQQRQEITTRAITSSIDQWATRYPALTADDKAAVRAQLEQVGSALVRPATPDEAQQIGVAPGSLVINHAVVDAYLKDRHTLRQQATAAATAAQQAAKENVARLGGTARPQKAPQASRPAVPAAREKSKAELWQEQKDAMLSGRYASDDE